MHPHEESERMEEAPPRHTTRIRRGKPEAEETNSAQQYRLGKEAFARLTAPVAGRLMLGRILGVISGILSVVPFIVLVHLGGILLEAYQRGVAPEEVRVQQTLVFLVGAFGLRLTVHFLALGITHFADIRLAHSLRSTLMERISRAPLSWFSATASGKIRKAIQDDTHDIHALIAHAPVEATVAIVSPLALLGYAFIVDWRLGFLSIATIPLYVLSMALATRGMGEKTAEMDQRLALVSSTMVEFVTGISVVKAFGRVGESHGRYQKAADEFSQFYLDWCGPMLRTSALGQAVISPALLVLVNLGGGFLMVSSGWVSAVDVIACSLIALMVPSSIEVLTNTTWSYQLAGAAALRIVEVMSIPALKEDGTQVPQGHDVVFEDVSFSYGDTLALDGVSLTIPEGSMTAFIGSSGSGKSTAATLIARFADPQKGRILIGGADVRHISFEVLYRHVSFVLQDPQLLDMSLRDNIALARPQASDEEIMRCATDAGIADFIRSLPRGLDTVCGEDTQLSGGQEQRISIARALLADTPIIILDEATAMTDPESEADIQEALTRLARGRTVIVVAHRPSSIREADQIVLLENGRVRACGSHGDMLAEPYYRRMCQRKVVKGRGESEELVFGGGIPAEPTSDVSAPDARAHAKGMTDALTPDARACDGRTPDAPPRETPIRDGGAFTASAHTEPESDSRRGE